MAARSVPWVPSLADLAGVECPPSLFWKRQMSLPGYRFLGSRNTDICHPLSHWLTIIQDAIIINLLTYIPVPSSNFQDTSWKTYSLWYGGEKISLGSTAFIPFDAKIASAPVSATRLLPCMSQRARNCAPMFCAHLSSVVLIMINSLPHEKKEKIVISLHNNFTCIQ